MFRSISSLASQFIMVPRYLNLLTCRRDSPFTVRLQVGMLVSCFFVITIVSVFLAFNSIPYIILFLSTICIKFCNFSSESANKTVSSAYLKWFMLCPPILMPSFFGFFNTISSKIKYWEISVEAMTPQSKSM